MAHVEKCRKEAEAKTRKRLPFDDDVLLYLLKVAPVSDPQETLELLSDFCPDWNVEARARLASILRDCGAPADENVTTGGTSFSATSEPSFGPGMPSQRSREADEMADRMLAQMLQEQDQEEAEATLNQAHNHQARTAKKQKKSFRPLNINYQVGRNAGTPAFGTAAPSSLADLLRTRRQAEQRAGDLQPENFGPPAARNASSWAPIPQDSMTGMTWAERAQLAAERAQSEAAAEAAQQAQYTQPASANAMQLKLRTATGTEYRITADRSETIGDVKARIAKQHNIGIEQQRILHLGRELADGQQLRSANIPDGQPLQLALRNASNPPPQPSWPPQTNGPSPAAALPQLMRGEERMLVRLRFPGGNSLVNLEGVGSSSTVTSLKQRVQLEHGIRHDHMSLSFFGSVLADEWTLADSGVANAAIIDVALITPKGNSLPETIRQAPTPQGTQAPGTRSEPSKKRAGGQQADQRAMALQSTSHGRVLNEAEALELALAASRGDEELASGSALQGPSPVDNDDVSGDEVPGESAGDTTDFMIDVSVKDDKISALLAHAKRVASEYFPLNLIGKVSKRSGFRLTLLVQRIKKPKRVLGYMVYRFRASMVYLLQLAIAPDQRNRGLTRHALKWMVQYTKKSNSELIVTCCRPESVDLYQKLGFKRGDAKALDVADNWEEGSADGLVCMEYRCRRGNNKDVKPPSRPDFEPPPAFDAGRPRPAAAASQQLSRSELITAVFRGLDVDGDGKLSQSEMKPFATSTGFDGSDAEWGEEYRLIISQYPETQMTQSKIALPLFQRLVNDESDEGCYCTDEDLRKMLADLPKPAAATSSALAQAGPAAGTAINSRCQLVRDVFDACDFDNNGQLDQEEMRRFAGFTGFDGSDQEWAEEYKMLCSSYAGQKSAIEFALFLKLVDDESDEGCYCTDDELRDMLGQLRAIRPAVPAAVVNSSAAIPSDWPNAMPPDGPRSRPELIRAVFKACDFDGDGHLCSEEMHRFANFTGFGGDDEEWANEYRILCSQYAGKQSYIDQTLFERLVDDESDDGCYCTDEELHEMLAKLLGMASREQHEPEAGARQGSASQALVEKLRETDSPTPITRGELIRAVFEACDADSDGCLCSSEMRLFAGFTGFEGSDQEWAEEFTMLCSQYAGTESQIDFTLFKQLVEDQSDDGCYCTDEELQKMLEALPKKSPAIQVNEVARPERRSELPPQALHNWGGDDVHEVKMMVSCDQSSSWNTQPAMVKREPQESEREKLIRTVFKGCDADSDGCLDSAEMKKFAMFTGFDGSAEDWAAEYKTLCSQFANSGTGIDLALFKQLVEDDSDEGCYCTDDELRDIANELQRTREVPRHNEGTSQESRPEDQHPSPNLVGASSSAPAEPTERKRLIRAVFEVLDVQGAGYLSSAEMRRFAHLSGFDGDDEEWASEYSLLCSHGGTSRSVIDLSFFEALVEDESDEGCYLTDGELREAVITLQSKQQIVEAQQMAPEPANDEGRENKADEGEQEKEAEQEEETKPPEVQIEPGQKPVSALSHLELIRAVFKACDADGDGRLDISEMLQFARFTGFDGSEMDWQEEYQMLCSQYKGNRSSIDSDFFQQLVEDDSDDGCYCTDEELREMLSQLQPEPEADSGPAERAAPASQPEAPSFSPPPGASIPEPAPNTRRELIHAVFKACDVDKDGLLCSSEMRVFAGTTGFSGSDDEWEEEFKWLCAQFSGHRSEIDATIFERLVDDESENGCYCSDEELSSLLTQLKAAETPATPVPPQEAVPASQAAPVNSHVEPVSAVAAQPISQLPASAASRSDLARAVFRACDADGDGHLSCQEMRSFAGRIGFEGSDAEWAAEYQKLLSERGGNSTKGIDLDLFLQLLEDESDDGCYCTDGELRTMLHDLFSDVQARAALEVQAGVPPVAAPSQRTEQLWQLFKALDKDGDGRLSAPEMRRFAGAIGFEGDDATWQEEFDRLFENDAGDPAEGLGLPLFMRLVEDDSEDGCYCADSELQSLLNELKAEQQEKAAAAAEFSAGPAMRAPPGLAPPSPVVGPSSSQNLKSERATDDGDWHFAGDGEQDHWEEWDQWKEPAHASWQEARDSRDGGTSAAGTSAAAADWWSSKDDDWWSAGDGNDWWWAKDSDHWSEAAPNQSHKGHRKGSGRGRGASSYARNGKGSNTWWAKR